MPKILKSPFLYALIPSLFFYIYIFSHEWIPVHDTFHVVNIGFYLFNEYVQNGSLPLWNPLAAYGLSTNWYLAMYTSPSLYFLLPVAKVLSGVHFFHLFYFSLFLDELVLLVGVYKLARYLFRNALSAIFVCIALAGSTLWFAQMFWNFHLYYALPLAFYFTLKGCQESSFWRILLVGTILVLTAFGNAFYFPVLQGYVFLVFFFLSAWAYKLNLKAAFKKFGKAEIVVLICLLFLAAAYFFFFTDAGQIVTTRKGGGYTVDFNEFLTYGGSLGLSKFSELFTGTSWNTEINIYSGIFVLGFALFALFWNPSKKLLPFLIPGVLLFLLSLGKESFIAPFIYNLPGVSYFRHIGLVLPLIKFFLVFLAGFGFDSFFHSLLEHSSEQSENIWRLIKIPIWILIGMLLVCILLSIVHGLTQFHSKVFNLSEIQVFNFQSFGEKNISRFASASEYAERVAFVLFLYCTSIFLFILLAVQGKRFGKIMITALLCLHTIDLLSYRTSLYQEHMIPVDNAVWNLFYPRKYSYHPQRIKNYEENANFKKLAPSLTKLWERRFIYENTDWVLDIDPCQSKFMPHGLKLPWVEEFFQIKKQLPMDPSLDKISGCGYPKLQVLENIEEMKNNRSLPVDIHVETYTSDSLSLTVQTTEEKMNKNYWLYYADAWHPFWKATVNGKETPILKANLAFKAIEIPSGKSVIQFVYLRPLMKVLLVCMWFVFSVFIMLILWEAGCLLMIKK